VRLGLAPAWVGLLPYNTYIAAACLPWILPAAPAICLLLLPLFHLPATAVSCLLWTTPYT